MTKQEFEDWKAHTELSTHKWTLDPIHNGKNGQNYLFHIGGCDGQYIIIDNGDITVGDYIGALPHIGEALFQPLYNKHFDDDNTAIKVLIETAGLSFLIDIMH